MVSQNGVSDLHAFVWPGGTFALENVLVATAAMLSFERGMVALIRVRAAGAGGCAGWPGSSR